MEWYQLVLLLIDMGSFSSLWYWIGLAVLWSSVSHWTLGVPFDLLQRAQRQDSVARQDLRQLALISARRIAYISANAGVLIVSLVSFALTALLLLAVLYRVELAQAILLMMLPVMMVAALRQRLAQYVIRQEPAAHDMMVLLARHRIWVKTIGMVAIFVTSLFGMYHNFT